MLPLPFVFAADDVTFPSGDITLHAVVYRKEEGRFPLWFITTAARLAKFRSSESYRRGRDFVRRHRRRSWVRNVEAIVQPSIQPEAPKAGRRRRRCKR